MRLTWKGFLSWFETTHMNDMVHMDETLRRIDSLGKDVSQDTLKEVLENSSCKHIMELFEVYRQLLRDENGSLSTFWVSYLDMVEILLALI